MKRAELQELKMMLAELDAWDRFEIFVLVLVKWLRQRVRRWARHIQ